MLLTERGAARGDRGGDAGEVAGHHVGVALDHDGLRGPADVVAGEVESVEDPALLVERGLGGVEVLRLDAVVVEDPPGAEPDGLARGVADRPEQPAAEPVVVAALALCHEAGRNELGVGELLLAQVLVESLSVTRGEAEAEVLGGVLVEAAFVEELPRGDSVGAVEALGVERGRQPVRLDQPATRSAVTARPVIALDAPELDAGAVGEVLDRLRERETVVLHHEGDDVATLAAPEAHVTAAWTDVKGRRLLVVKGTQALEGPSAGGPEGDVLADDVREVSSFAHQRDVLLADQPGHGRSLCPGTDGRVSTTGGARRPPKRPSGSPPGRRRPGSAGRRPVP